MKMESLARLTASIAHEIRNPLGALSNAAQLLGETPQQNGEGRRLIKIIDDQSRRMNVIVENVTQLSRRDHVSPMRFALDPWLREFARQYADTTRVPREIFSFTATEGVEVCMDPEQLHQVVANLCQNALRHSPPYTGTPADPARFRSGHRAAADPGRHRLGHGRCAGHRGFYLRPVLHDDAQRGPDLACTLQGNCAKATVPRSITTPARARSVAASISSSPVRKTALKQALHERR